MAKYDKVISPGQEGKIELAVDGKRVHGEFNKSAAVSTNDPEHPQMTLTITGRTIPYVSATPDGTIYLQGRYNEPIDKVVTLASNESDLDFKVTGVTSNIDDKITYKVEPGTQKGEYLLHVFKNPKLPTMSTYGSIFVHSNSKHAPVTTLQVQVMTKGSISVSPTMINFGAVKFSDENGPGTPAERSLVASKATGTFHITGVTISDPTYKAVVEPVLDGQQYRVQVTFTPPEKKQPRQNEAAEMIIHTDDPTEPAIRVQLLARAM